MQLLIELVLPLLALILREDPELYAVGFAQVDVTPTESIRLSGYAARGAPTAAVDQRLYRNRAPA